MFVKKYIKNNNIIFKNVLDFINEVISINYLLSYFAYLFSEPIGTHVLFEELGNLDNFFLYY